ncbi:MAG: efflux transporter outer membrane subunit [Candidatus Gastranaerophilaceae bacterium]|jgi:NodT family efflux transporter outer membrane factor (OMF) lipoprotein
MSKCKLLVLFLLISFWGGNATLRASNLSSQATDRISKATSSPKTEKPDPEPQKKLKANVTDNTKAEYVNKSWWDKFHDPVLSGYIAKAVSENQDLKIASLKVLESQETVNEYFGKEFPLVGLNLNYARAKTSDNLINSFSSAANTYTLPLNVNYELDLWRKNREKTIQTAKTLETVKYDEKASYISLTSAVASAYFNVLNVDRQLQLQKEIVNIRKSILELTKNNYDYGLINATDVTQADRLFTEAQSGLFDLQKQQSILLNQLAILLGTTSDSSSSLKRSSIDDVELIKDLPLNIKSEVVQQRPDILKAEADLQKSKIDIDLARKDFFPKITLSGVFGFNSSALSNVLTNGSNMASLGSGLANTLFSGGQRRARLKFQKYKYQELTENYHKTVLQSFKEVNDSLASLKSDTEKNNNNISRIKSENDNLDIILNKYEKGAISYLDTLQYRERVLSLEEDQIQSKTDCLIDSLSFYKAVGGKL